MLRRAILLALVIVGSMVLAGRVVSAQSNNPGPEWDPPLCGPQKYISSIYDNKTPQYLSDQHVTDTVLFSGDLINKCGGRYSGHNGYDFPNNAQHHTRDYCGHTGQPANERWVFAAQMGTVRRSRWFVADQHDGRAGQYGLHLDITHDDFHVGEISSLYGHLAAVFVEEGDIVGLGQIIGWMGETGHSYGGAHLHFMGAKGDNGAKISETFDIFGWNRKFGSGFIYPGYPNPWKGDTWPMRAWDPGEPGPKCPTECGDEVIIEDDAPTVSYGCSAGLGLGNCPGWQQHPVGSGNGHHWVYPNGPSMDNFVIYSCPTCGLGTFAIQAWVPNHSQYGSAHIARYEAAGRVGILDQHQEGGLWQTVGVYHFTVPSVPNIMLSDRTDRYDYTDARPHRIAADKVRFVEICRSSYIDPDDESL